MERDGVFPEGTTRLGAQVEHVAAAVVGGVHPTSRNGRGQLRRINSLAK